MLKAEALIHLGFYLIVSCTSLTAQTRQSVTSNTVHNRPELTSIIERMQQAEANLARQAPYQVTREYRLFSGQNTTPTSQVLAVVNFRAAEGKDYRIEQESGSNRGEQIVKRILDHEVEESTRPTQAQARALAADNYNFEFVSETLLDGHPCYILSLTPKRKDTNLIAGEAWVDKNSFLVRHIEGELVKTPSWWLKKVSVKITFSDVQGAWTQSEVEAMADARLVGQQTLRSHALRCQGLDVVVTSQLSATPLLQTSHRKQQINRIPAEAILNLGRN